jgi:DNA-binding NtrC family response regulator
MTRILLVEPDPAYREGLRSRLEDNGFTVVETPDLADIAEFDPANLHAVISNAVLPSRAGVDLLSVIGRVPLILIAEQGSVEQAVSAMKLGVRDYLVRPFDSDQLIASIEQLIDQDTTRHSEIHVRAPGYPMIGSCAAMLELFDHIRKIAPTESTVLILGESGTGKDLVARALHTDSQRQQAPMISLNCAAIPETLLEAELFGQELGGSTGASTSRSGLIEAAHGGTLLLDEIGELPMEAQARLLRVLQEGEIRRVGATETRQVDIRLIATSHRDLQRLTQTNHFREDLFYRLNVLTLVVPPLRERGQDIVELCEHLLRRACDKLNKPLLQLSADAMQAVRDYHWPGNVRELENAMDRAVILCEGNQIERDLLAIDGGVPRAVPAESDSASEPTSLEDYFVHFVTEHEDQLTETELAEKLGISRKSLWERRQRLNIPRKRTRKRGTRR